MDPVPPTYAEFFEALATIRIGMGFTASPEERQRALDVLNSPEGHDLAYHLLVLEITNLGTSVEQMRKERRLIPASNVDLQHWGVFQEMNRRFLHPIGLEIYGASITSLKTQTIEILGFMRPGEGATGIVMTQPDPEDITIRRFRKKRFRQLRDNLAAIRKRALGFVIEPIR